MKVMARLADCGRVRLKIHALGILSGRAEDSCENAQDILGRNRPFRSRSPRTPCCAGVRWDKSRCCRQIAGRGGATGTSQVAPLAQNTIDVASIVRNLWTRRQNWRVRPPGAIFVAQRATGWCQIDATGGEAIS